MSFLFSIRDCLLPRRKILDEIRIKSGFKILDYGAGAGSYSLVAAKLVGEKGKIYSLDIHPLATKTIQQKATRKGLKNVETIQSDCATGLPDKSIDIVFLHDIYHDLTEPAKVLEELHRVLKPAGIISFNDHHIKGDNAVAELEKNGLFKHTRKGKKIHIFSKVTE
jgi:ubiquinone/menaquinone biosynthesis C-methylase UbiE